MSKSLLLKGNSFVLGARLISLLLLTVTTSASLAWAKGPWLTPPPITLTLYTQSDQTVTPTQEQAASIGSLIQTFPQLYNSSWRPAIHDLASRANQSLAGVLMDHIRLVVAQQQGMSGQYVFTAYFGTISNGSIYEKIQHSYAVDRALAQTLTKLGLNLEVYFSLSGPYVLTPQAGDFLFYFTDPYFHHFGSISVQIARSLPSLLTGKGLSWLGISMLDENAVRIDVGTNYPPNTVVYFGTGGNTTTATTTMQTATLVSTESLTSTILSTSTSTVTQSPQTVTITSTISTLSSSNSAKLDYSANAVSGIVLGIIIALIGSIASVTISRKR